MADNQKSALKPRNSTKPHTDSRDNKKRFFHHANTNKKTTIIKGVNQSSSFASSQQVAEIIHNHDSKPKSDQGE